MLTQTKTQPVASLTDTSFDALAIAYQQAVADTASSVIQTLDPNAQWYPVNTGGIGSFPWSYETGSQFNANTYAWIDNLFAFQSDGNYYSTNGSSLITAYLNLFNSITYVMSPADTATYEAAITDNNSAVQTLITNWQTSMGQIPLVNSPTANTQAQDLNYIQAQVLTWATTPPLTLSQLQASLEPATLLKNAPASGLGIISGFIKYLSGMSSCMTIINEQASFDAQVAVIINNLTNPAANSGWMTTVNDNGQTANVPAFTITPSVPGINNSLLPSSSQTGVTFSCAMAVSDISDSSTSVSFNGGAGIEVDLDFLVFAGAETSVSYNASTFNENAASINATMTFDGVTAVSIIPAAYNSSSNIGWWEPDFISQAANGSSSVSGPQMIPASNYNLGANGNFGVVNEIFISQMPTFSLVYQSTDISGFQETLSTDTSWGVSFLGIPLCGGSTTTNYSASAEQTSATEITITMTPPVGGVAVSANDQLANVIGATMVWPGQAN